MAAFSYIALDQKGKRKKGLMEADTAREVRQKLRDQGFIPLEVEIVSERGKSKKEAVEKKRKLFRRKRFSASDLALVTRQLATLLTAGIPLDEVLSGVAEQAEKTHIKSILLGVRAKVVEGYSLATAMNEFPSAFPKLYRITVASGENSGKLDQVLNKLADFTERQNEVKQKIRQAMIYPTMMTVVSIGVVVFLLIYVVPKIVDVFSQTKQTLPYATTVLISISEFLKHYGIYLIIALIILAYIFYRLLKNEKFRYRFDSFILKLPIIGRSIKTVNSARFGRTFGILFAATVPVLDAMRSSSQLITPLPMRNAVEASIERVREGTSVSAALRKTGYFAPMFIHLIASGEASGQLSGMLERAALNQERDVEALIQGALTLFEPILILVMGGVVLFIVLAIMLPIFALDQFPG